VTGLLHVDGVTLDCSSSDDTRALRNVENNDEPLGEIQELECDDDADDNSLGDLEDILSDDEVEVVELENSEDEQNEDQISNQVRF